MGTWETATTRPALAGWVADAQTNAPLKNITVAITAGPADFNTMLGYAQQKYGAQWDFLTERLDRTLTATDGHFIFWNLPPGDYTLAATWPAGGSRYSSVQGTITVVATGTLPMLTLALPPTGVQGKVTDAGGAAVMLAQVLLQDSGEAVFSDEAGNYQLLGVEAGARTLLVSPPGSTTPASQVVTLTQGATATQDIQLSAT